MAAEKQNLQDAFLNNVRKAKGESASVLILGLSSRELRAPVERRSHRPYLRTGDACRIFAAHRTTAV